MNQIKKKIRNVMSKIGADPRNFCEGYELWIVPWYFSPHQLRGVLNSENTGVSVIVTDILWGSICFYRWTDVSNFLTHTVFTLHPFLANIFNEKLVHIDIIGDTAGTVGNEIRREMSKKGVQPRKLFNKPYELWKISSNISIREMIQNMLKNKPGVKVIVTDKYKSEEFMGFIEFIYIG